jgi:hypothetical protein
MKNALPAGGLVVKALSQTRWSARADAVKSVFEHYKEIISALSEISGDNNQTMHARAEAEGLAKKMRQLETALMTVIWSNILSRFNATSLSLQKDNIDLLSVVKLYESLIYFVSERRNTFDELEKTAKTYVDNSDYKELGSRIKRRKRFFEESSNSTPDTDTELSPRDGFRIDTFNRILDCLTVELQKRLSSYSELNKVFGFLTDFRTLTQFEVRKCAANLAASYPSDLEATFEDEFVQFSSIIAADEDKTVGHMNDLLKADGGLLLASFPNVGIALRIYLTIPTNNCQGERSFSTLSRVKNHLRTTMSHPRLVALSLMCIESELLRNLDFTEVIEEFAAQKSRKKDF